MEHMQNVSIGIALGLSLIALIVAEKARRLACRLQSCIIDRWMKEP